MAKQPVILPGDMLAVLPTLYAESVDSCVTDPPYGLKFMGREWDAADNVAFRPETWAEVYRVLKPGAHLIAFSGTRTYHRMACAIEDAGFEIRDQIGWLYGSGFPKSHDVSKGIDRAAGAERAVVGSDANFGKSRIEDGKTTFGDYAGQWDITAPATAAARQWEGWGTALKPAQEPVVIAQKPYTIAQLLAILVPTIGGLICRVVSSEKTDTSLYELLRASGFWSIATSLNNYLAALSGQENMCTTETATALTTDLRILKSSLSRIMRAITIGATSLTSGDESDALLAVSISRSVLAKCERLTNTIAGEIAIDWLADEGSAPAGGDIAPLLNPIVLARKPLIGTVAANVLKHGTGAINIDGCRVEANDKGEWPITQRRHDDKTYTLQPVATDNTKGRWPANIIHDGSAEVLAAFPDTGGGSFAGPSARVRNNGLGLGTADRRDGSSSAPDNYGDAGSAARFFWSPKADSDDRLGSKHPTVKPVDLMAYLCRLVTPPGGTVLDPFAGSGTTGMACMREGFDCILIEREEEYAADIKRRLAHVRGEDTPLFSEAAQ